MPWKIIYYETTDGDCPIRTFIESRGEREQAKIFSWVSLLEEQGPQLPRPYADLLEDGIHELRIRLSGEEIRVLYFFCYRDFIVLTHVFSKHTQRVPPAEIRGAQRCRSDFLSRYDEETVKQAFDEDI
jgi:phage-related protein